MSEILFDELDPPVRALVAVLNDLPCVQTIGSCGGHEVPISGASLPADSWHVLLQLEPGDPDSEVAVPSRQAWLDLEFLTWHVNGPYGRWEDRRVHLVGTAAPPFENEAGRMIVWELWGVRGEGDGVEPDEVAASLRRDLDELYMQRG